MIRFLFKTEEADDDAVNEFAHECLEEIKAHIIEPGEEVLLVSTKEVTEE